MEYWRASCRTYGGDLLKERGLENEARTRSKRTSHDGSLDLHGPLRNGSMSNSDGWLERNNIKSA